MKNFLQLTLKNILNLNCKRLKGAGADPCEAFYAYDPILVTCHRNKEKKI